MASGHPTAGLSGASRYRDQRSRLALHATPCSTHRVMEPAHHGNADGHDEQRQRDLHGDHDDGIGAHHEHKRRGDDRQGEHSNDPDASDPDCAPTSPPTPSAAVRPAQCGPYRNAGTQSDQPQWSELEHGLHQQ